MIPRIQSISLLRRGRDPRDRALHRHVREPDERQPVGLRQREDEATRRAGHRDRQCCAGVPETLGADHDVAAPRGDQAHGIVELVGPGAGGVDDVPRAHAVRGAVEPVAQLGLARGDRQHLGARQDRGPVGGSRPGDGDDQAGIVLELAVPEHHRPAHLGPGQRRHELDGLLRVQGPGPGQQPARGPGGGPQDVRGRQPTSDQPGIRLVGGVGVGHHLRQRVDEVRGDHAGEDRALPGALPGDAHLPGGEVAQAAMDELAGPARGPGGEVVALDEGHAQPSGCGVEGDADAGDPPADHEHVQGGALLERGAPAIAAVPGEQRARISRCQVLDAGGGSARSQRQGSRAVHRGPPAAAAAVGYGRR